MGEDPKVRAAMDKQVQTLRQSGYSSERAQQIARECAERHDRRQRGEGSPK